MDQLLQRVALFRGRLVQAVIFAGGQGIKLRPLTFKTPKPLLPVINKPIIDIVMFSLIRSRVDSAIVIVDHLGDQIIEYLSQNDFGIPITFHRHTGPYLGSAQILKTLSDQLEEEFVIAQGDCVFDLDLAQAVQMFRHRDASIGLIVRNENDVFRRGSFRFDDDGQLQAIVDDEPDSTGDTLSDTWVTYLRKEVIALIPDDIRFDVHVDLFQSALDSDYRILGFPHTRFWGILGRIHPYLAANFWLLQNLPTESYVGANTDIPDSVRLIPPYFIDENVQVGESTVLGPNAIIQNGVKIGKNVELSNTLVHHNSVIGDDARLEQTIVANDCQVGARCHLAAMTVLGANTRLGDDSTTEAGSRVGPDLRLPPNSRIQDVLLPHGIVSDLKHTYTLFLHRYIQGLTPDQILICLTLQSSGEMSRDGLVQCLPLEPEVIDATLDGLLTDGIVRSYGQDPAIYSLVNDH